MKRFLGQRSLLMVALGVILAALATTAITAQAKPTSKSSSSAKRVSTTLVTKNFSVTKVAFANDPKVKTCVRITVYGTFQYKKNVTIGYKGMTFRSYTDRKIISPTMTAKTFAAPRCTGAGKAVRVSKASLYQRWYATDCTFNPGIGVSALPWTVSVAPTITCGDVTAAQRKASFSSAAASYRQSNSGKVVSFGGSPSQSHGCLSLDASVQVYKKNASDNADASFKVCPS
ncbi:hypothetical protein GA0074695_0582 [Micromonospora viridifaciens]|uniref:Uncharacterized protein n=1 Tax=Micromonospora viridifaciens TaxID=1881 RepID=A0A1C4UKC1_MICVI|nr:hypothetical protein [Micromonospora viridifaciens]SCE72130.1 hypothetical protein GA0074695_0582 [Micromonospora viridifaciens]